MGIEAFCPSRTEIKIWSDRKKKVVVPLISQVVLIKTEEINREKVFAIPGTIKYLFWLGKPAIVREIEVEQLRGLSENKNVISHEVQQIRVGKRLDLTSFGFSNTNGIVRRVSNNVYWVALETLGYILKVTYK